MGCESITGLHPALNLPVPIYTSGWREALKVKHLFEEHSTMVPARARTQTTQPGGDILTVSPPHLHTFLIRCALITVPPITCELCTINSCVCFRQLSSGISFLIRFVCFLFFFSKFIGFCHEWDLQQSNIQS